MRRRTVLRKRLAHEVIVTLQSGDSFRGVLWEADAEAVVLRNVAVLEAGPKREAVAVDGEVVLLRDRIDYLQKP